MGVLITYWVACHFWAMLLELLAACAAREASSRNRVVYSKTVQTADFGAYRHKLCDRAVMN
jgi:hypothetical protein